MKLMIPVKLAKIISDNGKLEHHKKDKVFHSQSFDNRLFKLQKGYVKRYQVTNQEEKVIELIYGPNHIFPLSQLYKEIFGIEQNQQNFIYVYQAMTDIEIFSIPDEEVLKELEKDPLLYIDLYYESGLRLKSNIDRLASNSFHDIFKKVAHQLFCLAEEFGSITTLSGKECVKINVPLSPTDIAEQLNISKNSAEAVIDNLSKRSLISVKGQTIYINSVSLLQDVFL